MRWVKRLNMTQVLGEGSAEQPSSVRTWRIPIDQFKPGETLTSDDWSTRSMSSIEVFID